MHQIIKEIPIAKIDRNDDLYFLSHSSSNIKQLDPSVLLFFPVWLQETEKGNYRIVDGFRIIPMLIERQLMQEIPAFVFPETFQPLHIWKQRVLKRYNENNLAYIDLLESLYRILLRFGHDTIPEDISCLLADFGLPSGKINFKKLAQLIAKSNYFDSFTDLYGLSLQDLLILAEIPEDKLSLLAQLLADMRLKSNKLMSLINTVNELEKGYNILLGDILADPEVRKISQETQSPIRYRIIKERLLQLRYPNLSELKKKWNRLIRRLQFQTGIEVQTDPYFENDELLIILKSQSIDGLSRQIDELIGHLDDDEFKQLFEFV